MAWKLALLGMMVFGSLVFLQATNFTEEDDIK